MGGGSTVEWMLGDWYDEHEASGESRICTSAEGAEYAARGATSEIMCLITGAQARRLINSGESERARALIDEMIPLANAAGLDTGRARLLQCRGSRASTR